jgi:tRNA1(Val) A37 N6-methylase TrmN6
MADPPEVAFATTSDSWLGGKLTLRQPASGHRVGSDAVLLAAAAPEAERIVDVGAGVGAVGLALLKRIAGARVDLVEIDGELAALAAENARENGLAERARVIVADVTIAASRRAAGLADAAADLVVTNPPFFDAPNVRVSPEARRARAHVLPTAAAGAGSHSPAAGWLIGALALLAPGGRFVMIHRSDALTAILTHAENRLGAITILPIYPYAETPAHRLLIAGVKGARAPLSFKPGLILHEPSGTFTKEAEALHRGDAAISLIASRGKQSVKRRPQPAPPGFEPSAG